MGFFLTNESENIKVKGISQYLYLVGLRDKECEHIKRMFALIVCVKLQLGELFGCLVCI